jgi:phage repressor protein C with HTH and peptisase S24 domain
MRSTNWIILGILLVVIVVVSSMYSGMGTNKINIIINTNGTDTDINYQTLVYGSLVPEMTKNIKEKVTKDVESSNSTVESIKSDVKTIASKYNYNADVTIVSQFGTDQLPMPATVNGTSMNPTLQDGQEIIVLKTNNLNVGDIVVAVHPTYGLIVKRLSVIDVDQVYLTSDNKNVEISNSETTLPNGTVETVTVKKTPLNTWLPKSNVIGVVKVY